MQDRVHLLVLAIIPNSSWSAMNVKAADERVTVATSLKYSSSNVDEEKRNESLPPIKHELVEAELIDPTHDTLHRGLKARQISMIAVSSRQKLILRDESTCL